MVTQNLIANSYNACKLISTQKKLITNHKYNTNNTLLVGVGWVGTREADMQSGQYLMQI